MYVRVPRLNSIIAHVCNSGLAAFGEQSWRRPTAASASDVSEWQKPFARNGIRTSKSEKTTVGITHTRNSGFPDGGEWCI